MRVYLDLCALKRLFDERREDRIRLEAEAVALILERADRDELEVVSSEALEEENLLNPDPVRRARAGELLGRCRPRIRVTSSATRRARELQDLGFGGYDAMHIACALQAGVDAFVTTDDRLLRLAVRHAAVVSLRVINPVDFART
ncbi:MAG: PIN domain-containing protein [Planctomycetota bacterium]